MCNEIIFITRKAHKSDAFVVGGNLMPKRFEDALTIDGDVYRFKHVAKDPLECRAGDIVYYGCERSEGVYLRLLDPINYTIVDGAVYERQPIYRACIVDENYPGFLADIDIQYSDGMWHLNSPRLRIMVHLGDYWIRDIDPENRYNIPVVSAIERDGYSFDKYWRCDQNGKLIEKLYEYDARHNSSAPTR